MPPFDMLNAGNPSPGVPSSQGGGFFDMLRGMAAPTPPTNGFSQADNMNAALSTIGPVGMMLLAASQRMQPAERAKILAGAAGQMGNFNSNLQTASQARLMNAQAQEYAQKQEQRKALTAALSGSGVAPGSGTTANTTATLVRKYFTGDEVTSMLTAGVEPMDIVKQAIQRQAAEREQQANKVNVRPPTPEERIRLQLPAGSNVMLQVRPNGDIAGVQYGQDGPDQKRTATADEIIIRGIEKDRTEKAAPAAEAIAGIHQIRKELDTSNAAIGPGTGFARFGNYIGAKLGIRGAEKANDDTAILESYITERVIPRAKMLGVNPSDGDVRLIKEVGLTDGVITKEGMQRVLQKEEELYRRSIDTHNTRVRGLGIDEGRRGLFEVKTPTYEPPVIDIPNPNRKAAPARGGFKLLGSE